MMWVKIAQITMFMLVIFLILGVPAHFVRCRATPGSAIASAPYKGHKRSHLPFMT